MKNILAKMAAVMADVGYIQKGSRNEHFGYNYASEKDIKEAIYPALRKHGVVFQLNVLDITPIDRWHKGTKVGSTLLCRCAYYFYDVESGESIEGNFYGEGSDLNDKGLYVGITGAIKYIMTSMFGIVTGDDPEDNKNTDKTQLKRDDETKVQYPPPTLEIPKAPDNDYPTPPEPQSPQGQPTGAPSGYMIDFGKHSGKAISDPSIPMDWFNWMEEKYTPKNQKQREAKSQALAERERRGG